MLKFLFMLMFMILSCFMKKSFWMVQNLFFFLLMLMILFLNFNFFYNNISYFLGGDLLSYGLIILSVWICALMILSSEIIKKMKNNTIFFLLMVLFLLTMLVLTFSTFNMFLFYLFFESSLIPTLFLILGWGYQPERLQAGLYLLFYTLLASLPLLMAIFLSFFSFFSMNFYLLMDYSMFFVYFYFSMVMAFLVKMPMFMVHLWLPKAHVEAPISGSMILAGVLLKLGGYGLLRVFPFLLKMGLLFNYWFISISLFGGMLVSFICLCQTDMKSLIAYSSVAHMGIVLSGLLSMTFWGLSGSYTLMLAHGLCSSGLFCLANFSYERLGSRNLMINKGLLNFMPSMALWWFLLCAGNMAAPPTLNLLGEVSLLNSIIFWSQVSMVIVMFLFFFSAAYSLYLYSYSQQGNLYSALFSFSMNFVREYLILMLHWLPLNIMILKSDICLLWL